VINLLKISGVDRLCGYYKTVVMSERLNLSLQTYGKILETESENKDVLSVLKLITSYENIHIFYSHIREEFFLVQFALTTSLCFNASGS
jgi:hypothetical protein